MDQYVSTNVRLGVPSDGTSRLVASRVGDLGNEKRHIQRMGYATNRYVCWWQVLRVMYVRGRGSS